MCLLDLTQIYLSGQQGITPDGEWSTLSCPNCPDETRTSFQNPQAISVGGGTLDTENLVPGCYELSYITDPVNVCDCADCEVYEMEILPGIIAAGDEEIGLGCINPNTCTDPDWLFLLAYLNCGTPDALNNGTVCNTSPVFQYQRSGPAPARANLPAVFGAGANELKFSPSFLGTNRSNLIDFGGNFQLCDGGAVVEFITKVDVDRPNAGSSEYWGIYQADRSRFNICKYVKQNPTVNSLQFTFTVTTARGGNAPSCGDCIGVHRLTVTWTTPPTVPAGNNQEICVSS